MDGWYARRSRVASGIAALAMLFSAPPARADDKQACMSAYVDAQRLRIASKLRASRAAAIQCSKDTCAERLRADCVAWLADLEPSIPTVVVTVVDAAGREITAARVSFDGEVLATQLDGVAIALDPGEHKVQVEAPGARPVEQTVLLRQGERDRPLRFELPPAPPPVPARPSAAEPVVTSRPVPLVAVVAAGIAGAGAVTWAVFGISGVYGSPGVTDLDKCSPRCAVADKEDVARKLDIAGVAAVVGVVALGVATYFYLTRPSVVRSPGSLGIRDAPNVFRF